MPSGIRAIIFGLGAILFVLIFELVRRRRLREELSITWFVVGILLMTGAIADLIIDPIAKKLGIQYPPALVFVWVLFCLIMALLYFSAVISDLKGQIKELTQKLALLEYEIEKKNSGEGEE